MTGERIHREGKRGHSPADDRATSAGIDAVERTARTLEALSDASDGLSVTELGARLQVSGAQAYRTLASLAAVGYVTKDDLTERYKLTTKLLSLAFRHLRAIDTYDLMLPILRRLANQSGEVAELNWVEHDRIVMIAKAESPRRIKVVSRFGEASELHATAAGKVWLASFDDDRALEILISRGMPRLTERTITSPVEFLDELRRVREQGYAVNDRELDDEMVVIAAPIRLKSEQNRVIGAVNVASPAMRPVHQRPDVIAATIEAADEIAGVWPFASLDP